MTTSITFDDFVRAFQATSRWSSKQRSYYVKGTNICLFAYDKQNYLMQALKQHETRQVEREQIIEKIKAVQIATSMLNFALKDLASCCDNLISAYNANGEPLKDGPSNFYRQLTMLSTKRSVTVDNYNDRPNLFEETSRHFMLRREIDGNVYVYGRIFPDESISHQLSKGDLQFCDDYGILVEPNVVMDPNLG
jgi:hypothetical protein